MREPRASEPVRLVEVELDEADATGPDVLADATGSGPATDPTRDGAPARDDRAAPRWRRWARWGAGGAVAALLVGAVAANLGELRRDRARAERLEGQPGVVASLADPLEERWRVEGYLSADLGDRLLLDTPTGTRSVDAATGQVVWSLEGEPTTSYCRLLGDAEGWWEPRAAEHAETLVCLGDGALGDAGAPAAPLLVVDVATGAVRARLPTPGAVVSVEPVGEQDVVVVAADPSGSVLAARWDTASGQRRWEVRTTATPFRPASAGMDALGWSRSGDVLRVTGSRGDAVVDLASGRELDPRSGPDAPDDGWTVELPDGSTAVWEWDGEASGAVREADGSVRFALPAPVLEPSVDDGTAPDVLLVDDGGLTALDLATGRTSWSREFSLVGSTVLVDGVLAGPSDAGTVGLDVRTGETLWEAGSATGGLGGVTDGERVLAAEQESGAYSLVARDLHTGDARWSVPFDEPFHAVLPARHAGVLVMTQSAVVALG